MKFNKLRLLMDFPKGKNSYNTRVPKLVDFFANMCFYVYL